jgi:hypothetical protein
MDKWKNTLTANNNFSHLNSSINVFRRKNHKNHLARPCKKCSPISKAVGIRRLDSLKADRGKALGSPVKPEEQEERNLYGMIIEMKNFIS